MNIETKIQDSIYEMLAYADKRPTEGKIILTAQNKLAFEKGIKYYVERTADTAGLANINFMGIYFTIEEGEENSIQMGGKKHIIEPVEIKFGE